MTLSRISLPLPVGPAAPTASSRREGGAIGQTRVDDADADEVDGTGILGKAGALGRKPGMPDWRAPTVDKPVPVPIAFGSAPMTRAVRALVPVSEPVLLVPVVNAAELR